jgi:hypothetical protein
MSSFVIYSWIVLHFKDIDHNRSTVRTLYMPMQFSKHVILNAMWFSRNWYSKTPGNSKRLNVPFIAFQTISFKSVGTDATKPLNFNKRQTPPPPAQCCVPFLVRFDVFWLKQHWLGWRRGRGAVLCVKNCNDPLSSWTYMYPNNFWKWLSGPHMP